MMRVLILFISLFQLWLLTTCSSVNRQSNPYHSTWRDNINDGSRGECYRYELCRYKNIEYHCIMDSSVVEEIIHFFEVSIPNEMKSYKISHIEGSFDRNRFKHPKSSCCYAKNKSNGCDTLEVTTIDKNEKFVPNGNLYMITKDSLEWKIISYSFWSH